MDNPVKKALFKPAVPPLSDIHLAIRDVCDQLDHVQRLFEMETDEDLIDSYIYQLEALRSRYRFLLRLAKEQSLSAVHVPLFSKKEA